MRPARRPPSPGSLFRALLGLHRRVRPGLSGALLGASAVLLGACAAPDAVSEAESAVAQAPEPPAGANGRYRGTARLIRAETGTCPRSGPRTLEVSGGAITLSYSTPPRNRTPLTAPIQADGRIEAGDGVGSMDGHARDGRLEVTIASAMCEHRWTLTKVE